MNGTATSSRRGGFGLPDDMDTNSDTDSVSTNASDESERIGCVYSPADRLPLSFVKSVDTGKFPVLNCSIDDARETSTPHGMGGINNKKAEHLGLVIGMPK